MLRVFWDQQSEERYWGYLMEQVEEGRLVLIICPKWKTDCAVVQENTGGKADTETEFNGEEGDSLKVIKIEGT